MRICIERTKKDFFERGFASDNKASDNTIKKGGS